jgi:class 3 adenylate cyclase
VAEERRVVTILFADVAGSTALGEALDPEDARILLRGYYDLAKQTVSEYGGILEKFIGDAVVAVFGFPQTHDDDPQRGLSAALSLRDRVRGDPALGERLPIRLGVNTGEVVATRESATGDFPLTGDAVNVAARLQAATEPWGILCGQRTAASARTGFEFGSPVDIDARGKSQPIRAVPLLGRAEAGRMATRTALIGRDADLEQLELAARRALQEKRPFLVSVIAPAGVGKTRLLEEFIDRLPGIESHATVAVAQCLPYGQRLTYWPLRGVLYRLIGVPDDTKPTEVRHAIRAWLGGSGVEAADRAAELLAATVGAGEAEVIDQSALLAAWRTFFEIAAHRSPLVLVFEDLHWSSDSLLDLFEFVMQPRGELPLLMIALTRPELLDRRPAWGGGRRNYVSIALEPLSDSDTATLVEQLLGGRSPDLVERVVRHAEGNPFFAGELVRSTMERPGVDQLPDTVQATVLARLDLLAPEERRMIQLGSVFGRSFRLAGIRAIESRQPDALQEAAERLMEKDLLRSAGGDSFNFRHILIREVAYQTLTRAERGRLHASAAAWLEGLAQEREGTLAELIAYHYREAAVILTAQRPGEAETDRIRRRAVDWLSQAADAAAAAAASLEGSRHLRSAIELAESDRLPDLYQRLGELGALGSGAVEAYQMALRLCREQGRSPNQELQILAGLLINYMRFQGSVADRPTEAAMLALRHEAHALAERVQDERILASYLAADGFFPFWLRGLDRRATPAEVAAAKTSAQRALEIARRLDDANLLSLSLDALSGAAEITDDWRLGLEFADERLRLRQRLSMIEKLDAYGMVAWGSSLLGELEEASRVTAEALAQVQPGQVPAPTLHIVAWRIYALTLLGRWDEALTLAERGQQLWVDLGRPATGYAVHGFMAAADIARARQDQQLLDRFAAVLDGITSIYPKGSYYRHWQGYGGRDLTPFIQAVEQFQLGGMFRTDHIERAVNRLLDQDAEPAVDAIATVLNYGRAHEFAVLEASAERGLGRAERSAERLQRSIGIFERVGAIPYAARARCERALITGDRAEMQAGLRLLERLGDAEQVGRFERLQVG